MSKPSAVLELCAQGEWAQAVHVLKSGKPTAKQVNRAGRDGLTSLHFACLYEKLEAVELLLGAGADPLAGDDEGTTCLHIAAKLANLKMARLLVDNDRLGADVGHADKHGSTPLHFAVEAEGKGAAKVVKFLLERGASAEAKDNDGQVPAKFAKADEIREVLASFADGTGTTSGESRRRRRGNEPSARDEEESSAAGARRKAAAAEDDAEGAAAGRRRRRQGAADQLVSDLVSAVGSRTEERRRRRRPGGAARSGEGDSALEIMLAQHEEREEARMLEQLSAGAPRTAQWDLALELMPEFASRDEDAERGDKPLTPAQLVARIRSSHVGLQSKLLSHPLGGSHLFLVVGADLARLAKEAERVGLAAQLKPELEKRLLIDKARERGVELAALRTKYDDDDELSELELGTEAYAPYRRAVHGFFQLAAAPAFFSCAQRTQLLRSILQAPREAQGADLSLAQLQRDGVVRQVLALHDQDERMALEDRWGVEAALALAPAPLAQLYNYFGAECALYFAFLRTLSMWLWAPAVGGLVLFVFQETEYGGEESVWAAFYSVLLVAWASAFLCHWKRLEATLEHQWGTPRGRDAKGHEFRRHERERFAAPEQASGFYEPVADDYQFVDLEREAVPDDVPVPTAGRFTADQRAVRQLASWAVIALCAAVSVVSQTGLLLLRSVLQETVSPSIAGGVLAALLNAVVVELLQALFKPVVKALVGFQNYRSAQAHEFHYSVQLFALMFVNRFFSLFYLAMLKGVKGLHLFAPANSKYAEVCRDRDGEPSDDCMEELFTQIVALLLLNLLVNHATSLGSLGLQRCRHRAGTARVAHEAAMSSGTAMAEDFYELSMSFGMVVLFAGGCPPAAAVALVSNALEGRSDAYKYLRATQRPQARPVADIGAWYGIFQFIAYLSIFTNAVLVCHTSTSLPELFNVRVDGDTAGSRFVMLVVLEHALLFAKILLDVLVPDVPASVVQEMALQRKLLALADEHVSKGTIRLGVGATLPAKSGAAADEYEGPPIVGQLRYEEADADDEEPKTEHPRMSDLGLLRSFRPGLEETLRDDDLQRKLLEASGKARSNYVDGQTKQEKDKAKGKSRKSLSNQLAWTPYRALEREGKVGRQQRVERFSCTDVVWLFPVLLVWLIMIAVAVSAFRWGQPPRLLYGVDYELNVCGIDNGAPHRLRFATERAGGFPHEVLPATARVEAGVAGDVAAAIEASGPTTGSRALGPSDGEWWRPGRGSKSYLFYADPARRLAICVDACPAVAAPADGLGYGARVCMYDFANLSYAERDDALSTHCFAAYDTVEVAGYCVPVAPLAQSAYDDAGVSLSAADLEAVRADVSDRSAARHLDAAVGDLLISWGVLLGTLIGAVVLGLVCVCGGGLLGLAREMYALSVLLTTAALCGLTYTFWVRGEARMSDAEAASADFGASYESARATARSGYALCALTLLYVPAALGLGALVAPSLPLVRFACRLIALAPGALGGAALAVLGQGCLLAFWFAAATHIASSGLLEFNADGFAHLTYGSTLKAMVGFHLLGGLWTGAIISHLGQLIASFALGHAYWRAAELKLRRDVPDVRQWLVAPVLHVGSVALGATVRGTLVSPLVFVAQLAGVRAFDGAHEAGYMAVALFGANLSEANLWGRRLTARFVPRVLRAQAHCAVFGLVAKMCVATTCASVAALVLALDGDFKDDVASIGPTVLAVFVIAYVLAGSFVGVLDLAIAAGVQSWCLDYKQNCVDQTFGSSETWMMGVELGREEAPALLELHEYLSAEREAASRLESARAKTEAKQAAPKKAPAAKGKARKAEDDDDDDGGGDEAAALKGKGTSPAKKAAKSPTRAASKRGAKSPKRGKSPTRGKKARALADDDSDDSDSDAAAPAKAVFWHESKAAVAANGGGADAEPPRRRRRPEPVAVDGGGGAEVGTPSSSTRRVRTRASAY